MKILALVLTLVFSVIMTVRLIEMSIQFDWIDILWTVIFLVCALICGGIHAVAEDD
jgi:hypothetical protein